MHKDVIMASKNEPECLVGLSEIPNQLHRLSAKKGYEFTVLVVGRSGLGKKTMLNALFETNFSPTPNDSLSVDEENSPNSVYILPQVANLEEKGIRVHVTKLDVVNFGEGLDASNHVKPVLDYILQQFEKYFIAERGLDRRKLKRTLVDCCIYCLAPWQRSLKPLDIEFMKQIQHHVNLVPVICKSDTLTSEELEDMKNNIRRDIRKHGITVYEPQVTDDDDEVFKSQMAKYKQMIPFGITASEERIEINGKVTRVRHYPWGVVAITDAKNSDFTSLRHFIVDNINDLRERTSEVHYENYRIDRLQQESSSNITTFDTSKAYGDTLSSEALTLSNLDLDGRRCLSDDKSRISLQFQTESEAC